MDIKENKVEYLIGNILGICTTVFNTANDERVKNIIKIIEDDAKDILIQYQLDMKGYCYDNTKNK